MHLVPVLERRVNAVLIYHVTPSVAGWAVQTDAYLDVSSSFADKVSALRHGQELARQAHAQLVVHREDGSIQAEHWY